LRKNKFNQPIGDAVVAWQGAMRPRRSPIEGRCCRVEPLDIDKHLNDLIDAFSEDPDGKLWTYMPVGPFDSGQEMGSWMQQACTTDDPLFYAVVEPDSGRAVGMAAYCSIRPELGVIEVGHIAYSPRLQKTPIASEAMFLLMKRAFSELGYRRYEWKCDSLNEASRRAAERFGFSFNGIFEQALVYKNRNRDTAWYSILDHEWPATEKAFQKWLDPANFDNDGYQQTRLRELIQAERSGN
jgi:RimJ/RimL family protein N-acetyltransferase